MLAVAACRAVHDITGYPVLQPSVTSKEMPTIFWACESQGSGSLNLFSTQLLEKYAHHKQNSLKLLSKSIMQLDEDSGDHNFVTAMLLALVEIFESGSGSWAVHIEGAKSMLTERFRRQPEYVPYFLNDFIREVAL
jgi:hypothetical protein